MPAGIRWLFQLMMVAVLAAAPRAEAQQWNVPARGDVGVPQAAASATGVSPAVRAFLKPIGAPSAVDQYRRLHETGAHFQTDTRAAFHAGSPAVAQQTSDASQVLPAQYASQVQQVDTPPSLATPPLADGYRQERQWNDGNSAVAAGGFAMPPARGSEAYGQNVTGQGSAAASGGAEFGSASAASVAAAQATSSTAAAAIPAVDPWADGSAATVSNSRFVTAPVQFASTYSLTDPCAPVAGVPYAGPAAVAPPTITPAAAPQFYTGAEVGYQPLFTLGQNSNVVLGRGIIGQPVAYVPGQTFRNFLRYISP